jgi:hypothetical protein
MSGSNEPVGPINLTRDIKRQGLDAHQSYSGRVVNNNDPRQLGRIKVRIPYIFDGISDSDLPWAVCEFRHCDGGYNPGGDAVDRSGTVVIPKVGHTVTLKFQDADPHRPVWGTYTIDEGTKLPEASKNYPNRAVWKFSNGTYMILDTKTNELFINNPGDLNMTILGDINQYIKGDQTLVVTGNYGDIDPYLYNAPETVLNRLKADPQKRVEWKGFLGAGSGNQHTLITGDQTFDIKGHRKGKIGGNDWLEVGGFQRENVKLGHIHVSSRMDNN